MKSQNSEARPPRPSDWLLNASVALLGSLALSGVYATEAPGEVAIHFKRGAYVASVNGELRSMNDEIGYVLSARVGQHMTVTVEAPGGIRGVVTSPDGNSHGEPGNAVFDDVLPLSGDYHIHLRESPMGEEWKGQFTLTVEIH